MKPAENYKIKIEEYCKRLGFSTQETSDFFEKFTILAQASFIDKILERANDEQRERLHYMRASQVSGSVLENEIASILSEICTMENAQEVFETCCKNLLSDFEREVV